MNDSDRVIRQLRRAFDNNEPVEGIIVDYDRSNLRVKIKGIDALCSLSQIELGNYHNPRQFINRKYKFRIIKFDSSGLIILSRAEVLKDALSTARVEKRHKKRWYEGPRYKYALIYPEETIEVIIDVTRSAPNEKIDLSSNVVQVIDKFLDGPGTRVLDFGGGAWLRYSRMLMDVMQHSPLDLYIVEYEEAFKNRSRKAQENVACLRKDADGYATFWTPRRFIKRSNSKTHFDLILLVNVLNTVPEVDHRRRMFKAVANRLRPLGWIVVDQRIWAKSENLYAPEHGKGWVIPQTNYCTYRAGTGANWFNQIAEEEDLKTHRLEIKHSSGNTFFRVWKRPFSV
jgi:hypothetical protein